MSVIMRGIPGEGLKLVFEGTDWASRSAGGRRPAPIVLADAGGGSEGPSGDESDGGAVVVAPRKQRSSQRDARRQPRYHVILWDSDDHTFTYVEKMLRELFGHEKQQCQEIAKQVDKDGKAVVLTTTREHAELKRDQIHAYGRDHLEGSKGSMWSSIEPDR